MRMRRKKNLEGRLAACGDKIIYMDREDRSFNAIDRSNTIDLEKLFGRRSEIQMEIGCGKGQFICELAQRFPEMDFLAVEKSSNVIVEACEKAIELGIDNLYFLRGGAEYLECYIPSGSISRLYLNFSCPYPKKSYASHRLTHQRFLEIYSRILVSGAELHQKTDNSGLFEFSIEQLSRFGCVIKNVSLDLHNSGFEGNIVTEYERKFSEQGLPIYRLEAVFENNG